jgi:hypothetical protein
MTLVPEHEPKRATFAALGVDLVLGSALRADPQPGPAAVVPVHLNLTG